MKPETYHLIRLARTCTVRIPKLRRNGDGRAFSCIPKTNGKRAYFGRFGTPEAERKYGQWIARLTAGEKPDTLSKGDRYVCELVELYLDWADGYYSDDTSYNVEYAVQVLLDLYGDELAKDVSPRWLTTIQDALIEKGRYRVVINDIVSRIRHMFRWCCTREYLPAECYSKLVAIENLKKGYTAAVESEDVRPVPYEHVAMLKPFVPPQIWAMIELQRLCGMRPQDVCRMRPCDVDCSRDIWIYRPPEHKTAHRGKRLSKAIPVAAQSILVAYLDRAAESHCFSPREAMAWRHEHTPAYAGRERKTPIYPSEMRRREKLKATRSKRTPAHRTHYDTDSYRKAIGHGFTRAESAGVKIPHWHPNQLRHAIATEVSQAIGQQAAQRWLGHSNLSTTNIYTEIQEKELIAIAKMLDARWSQDEEAA